MLSRLPSIGLTINTWSVVHWTFSNSELAVLLSGFNTKKNANEYSPGCYGQAKRRSYFWRRWLHNFTKRKTGVGAFASSVGICHVARSTIRLANWLVVAWTFAL